MTNKSTSLRELFFCEGFCNPNQEVECDKQCNMCAQIEKELTISEPLASNFLDQMAVYGQTPKKDKA